LPSFGPNAQSGQTHLYELGVFLDDARQHADGAGRIAGRDPPLGLDQVGLHVAAVGVAERLFEG
jgi:hypothetical protein